MGLGLDFILRSWWRGICTDDEVDAVAVEDATGVGVVGTKCAWMNRSGSGPETRVERYPRLLSVWAHRSRQLFMQKFPPKERTTFTGNSRDLRRNRGI